MYPKILLGCVTLCVVILQACSDDSGVLLVEKPVEPINYFGQFSEQELTTIVKPKILFNDSGQGITV